MPKGVDIARRTAALTLGAAAVGLALWPRTPRNARRAPAGRRVIEYWEKWTGPEGDAVQRMVDRFNDSQSRIFVVRTPVSDIKSKALVAIGGGDPPDLVGLYSYCIPQFAESGAAMALDPFGPTGTGIDGGRYAPAVRELLSYGGRLWAGVTSSYSLALYYNKQMFKEAGLDPDRPPRTIVELEAAAARFVERDGQGGLTRAGFLPNLPPWWPYFWPIMFGGSLYDARAGRVTLTAEANVRAYSWVQRFVGSLGPKAAATYGNNFARSFQSARDPFISGAVPMIVQGPWIANFLRLYRPDLEYGAGPVPVEAEYFDERAPTGMLEADVLIIPRGCPHPEEAFEFLAFTQRQEEQERLCLEHAKASPLREVSAGFAAQHPNRAIAVHDAVMRSPRVQVLPPTRVWQAYADMLLGAFDAMWMGADVRSTLARVEGRAQDLVDRAARRPSAAAVGSGA
ncbi:MAG: ABC transporter substrate-binding protein [Phycisphaerales bacterium]